jgi:hypothetical protein
VCKNGKTARLLDCGCRPSRRVRCVPADWLAALMFSLTVRPDCKEAVPALMQMQPLQRLAQRLCSKRPLACLVLIPRTVYLMTELCFMPHCSLGKLKLTLLYFTCSTQQGVGTPIRSQRRLIGTKHICDDRQPAVG